MELEPVAAIAVGKDGSAHLFTVEGDEKAGWSALLQEVPDIVSRLANAVGERMRHELSTRTSPSPQIAEQAADALPAKKS